MINEPDRRKLSENRPLQGAVIMSVFASIWEILGVSGIAPRVPGSALVGIAAVAVVLAVAAVVLTIRFGMSPGPRRSRRVAANSFRVFGRVNIGQTVAIVAAVFILGHFGQWVYIPAAVCLVVGAHFLPLARTFAQPQYWWTGGLLMALALVGAVALGGGDAERGRVLLGFGAALVLWTTALHVARKG
ncbi:hypothetical protein OG785_04900 [Streptomyces sp. NBC_00006]|uniref:hypothetical protein n=1 Tax=unclassified Streptomyces TaxID=2593676 RepID=UPI00224E7F4C|nr:MULTISPECIES: hypothetical protein [unclassified Streptomyces]MCX4834192.1 hypothetical protein [Streptomyces sp. NBC_01016]MCX5529897.1 hypothetical protein [Streptomyces sp. NBC_00006]